jgi:hypothetical protein
LQQHKINALEPPRESWPHYPGQGQWFCGNSVSAGTARIRISEKIVLFVCTPSVITLKPATCGHFKTGHFGWPET